MNETLKTIKNRRAIRQYHSDQLPDLALQEILTAALLAPSAMNKQSWHFTVIQNQTVLNELANTIIENIVSLNNKSLIKMVSAPHYHPFYKAPTLILISGDSSNDFIQIEAGAAAQNMALSAESLAIGSCIMTISSYLFIGDKTEELKDYLGIPKGYKPICCVALGYKAGAIPTVPPRNTEVINFIK